MGGGVVGVEMAGELAFNNPTHKKLGLCTRSNRLLPYLPEKGSNLAASTLKKAGI